jgi:hypothetical protein
MKKINRYAASALLAIALTAPLAMAQDNKRYYDKAHKDYHEWNDNEAKSYAKFREEKHIPNHDFSKAKPVERTQYWSWRHDHPDDKK